MKDRTLRAYLEAPTEKQLKEAFERGRVAGLREACSVMAKFPFKFGWMDNTIEHSIKRMALECCSMAIEKHIADLKSK